MRKLVALFGQSGAGKDTIQNVLLKHRPQDFHGIVSCTTRPMREGEVDGVNYHFLTVERFTDLMMEDQFIEALVFNDWCYGALISELVDDKINVGVFTPSGIEALYESAPRLGFEVLPIYVYCSDKTRLLRALNRETSPDIDEIIRRYGADKEDFADIDFAYTSIDNDSCCMSEDDVVNTIISRCKAFFD